MLSNALVTRTSDFSSAAILCHSDFFAGSVEPFPSRRYCSIVLHNFRQTITRTHTQQPPLDFGFKASHSFLDPFFRASPSVMLLDYLNVSTATIVCISLPVIYFFYYRVFRYFIFDQREKVTKGRSSRGKCPPFFPNGE